jgi:hypothetical protein
MSTKYKQFSIRIPPGIDKIVEKKCKEYGFKKNDFCNHAIVEYISFLEIFPKVEDNGHDKQQ